MGALFHLAEVQTHPRIRSSPPAKRACPITRQRQAGSISGTKKASAASSCSTEIFALLETEGWRYSADTGWKDWDVQIYGNQFWSITVSTVTEYHGGPKCLTRVHLGSKAVVTTVLVNAIILSILLYRTAISGNFDLGLTGILLKAAYLIFLFSMRARAGRLKRRVAELVCAAATRAGLDLMTGKKPKPAAPAKSG